MKKMFFFGTLILSLVALKPADSKEEKMSAIVIALGGNIVETAKQSGVAEFSVMNVDGFIEYSVTQIPANVPVIFNKPGYSLKIAPAFSMTLSSDRHYRPGDIVDGATILLSRRHLKSHLEGQAFVEQLISQFKGGSWHRYIPETCPAVTGRSSLLDIHGQLGPRSCGLDPDYKIEPRDWQSLFMSRQNYKWIGADTHTKLTVHYEDDSDGVVYNISLTLENFQAMVEVRDQNAKRDQQEGDAKGWRSSEKAAAARADALKRVRILEANAVDRGDKVVAR